MNMTANRTSVRIGQSVKLTCTVTPARSLDGMIVFVRHTNNGSLTCGKIRQYPDGCSRYFGASYYHVSCGSGTNTRASNIKTYILDIHGTKTADFTRWLCLMQNVTAKTNGVTLKQTGEQYFNKLGSL